MKRTTRKMKWETKDDSRDDWKKERDKKRRDKNKRHEFFQK